MRAEIDKIITLSEGDSTDELQKLFSSFTNEQVTSIAFITRLYQNDTLIIR